MNHSTDAALARYYRFAPNLFLERFDQEALLLVADCSRLLTINAAAADLFELAMAEFAARSVTVDDIANWLEQHYDLTREACHAWSRELLAFALKNHLADRVDQALVDTPG